MLMLPEPLSGLSALLSPRSWAGPRPPEWAGGWRPGGRRQAGGRGERGTVQEVQGGGAGRGARRARMEGGRGPRQRPWGRSHAEGLPSVQGALPFCAEGSPSASLDWRSLRPRSRKCPWRWRERRAQAPPQTHQGSGLSQHWPAGPHPPLCLDCPWVARLLRAGLPAPWGAPGLPGLRPTRSPGPGQETGLWVTRHWPAESNPVPGHPERAGRTQGHTAAPGRAGGAARQPVGILGGQRPLSVSVINGVAF